MAVRILHFSYILTVNNGPAKKPVGTHTPPDNNCNVGPVSRGAHIPACPPPAPGAAGAGLAVLVALGRSRAGRRRPAQSRPGRPAPVRLPRLLGAPLSHTAPTSIVSARGGERPTAPPTASPTPTPAPLQPSTYTVAEGDTVAALAARFGISPETILWANGLADGQALEVGRQLTILPVSGVLYNVRRGALLAIAQAHRAGRCHRRGNALAAPDLSIDQALIIPGGRPRPATPTLAAPARPRSRGRGGRRRGQGGEIIATARFWATCLRRQHARHRVRRSGFSQYVYSQVGIGIPAALQLGGPAVRGDSCPATSSSSRTPTSPASRTSASTSATAALSACSLEVGVVYARSTPPTGSAILWRQPAWQ